MKNLFTPALILLFCIQVYSQSFYETSWISNNVKYTAFIVQHTSEEALVAVKYFNNGSDKVALYPGRYKTFTKSDGTTDRYLNGYDAFIKRGPSGSSYSADNFYFKKTGNGNFEAYTVDDNGFKGGDITNYMKPTLYWIPIQKEALTKRYLDDYFDKEDALFPLLAFYGNGEAEFVTEKAAITALGSGITHANPPYDDSLWAISLSDLGSAAYTKQVLKHSDSFPSTWIKTQWDNGYFITSLEYDSFMNKYLVVMSKGPKLTGPQSWKKSETFPKEWVSEKWDNSYYITSMTNDGGSWYLAMTKNTGLGTQRWKTSYEIPKSWIEESWNMGYSITSATYGNGLWATCVSKNANLGLQSWKTATEWPIDWIRGKANDGYKITTIAYGDNRWFVVMSNSSSISYNTSITNYTDLPIDWILDKIRGIN